MVDNARRRKGAIALAMLLPCVICGAAEAPNLVGPFPVNPSSGILPPDDVDSLSQLPPPPPPPPGYAEKLFCRSKISANQAQIDAFNWHYGQTPAILHDWWRTLDEANKKGDKSPKRIPIVPASMPVPPKMRYPVVQPPYPQGEVTLMVAVSSKGKAVVALVACSDDERFSGAAIESMQSVKFVPATMNGKAVPDIVQIPFEFKL